MVKTKSFGTWVVRAGVLAVGMGILTVGLVTYVRAHAAPLHPQPENAPSVAQAGSPPEWSSAIDRARQIARATLADQNVPGLSIAVGAGDRLVWAEGFGWADIKRRVPVAPETRFNIGTASTVLTSAAVDALVEKSRLNLDDEIQMYVPKFTKKQWPVTLRQLVADRAGVATDEGTTGPLFYQRCPAPVDALPAFADKPLQFEPGTETRPSKYGWILVSAAIEAAAQQPFFTFMREQIFRPLGMNRTDADSSKEENPEDIGGPGEDAPPITAVHDLLVSLGIAPMRPGIPNRAALYVPRYDSDPRRGVDVMRLQNLSCYAGAMAFYSTASDLVRFGQHGKSQRTVDGDLLNGRIVSLVTTPDRGLIVAVMSNVNHADTAALARKIAEAFAR